MPITPQNNYFSKNRKVVFKIYKYINVKCGNSNKVHHHTNQFNDLWIIEQLSLVDWALDQRSNARVSERGSKRSETPK